MICNAQTQFQIFLVEDDAALRIHLVTLIERVCNASVAGTAETETDATAWLIENLGQWELAVIDLFLREGTGFGLLSNLPEGQRDRVVVLTNSATSENRAKCLELGARAVFDKTDELDNFLDHCIQRRKETEVATGVPPLFPGRAHTTGKDQD